MLKEIIENISGIVLIGFLISILLITLIWIFSNYNPIEILEIKKVSDPLKENTLSVNAKFKRRNYCFEKSTYMILIDSENNSFKIKDDNFFIIPDEKIIDKFITVNIPKEFKKGEGKFLIYFIFTCNPLKNIEIYSKPITFIKE